ncbi:hypothetical protein L228DRAFT_247029 [Xylona heveae TC161]|uniref:Derlin n=1 Tax=Xylona heveae (strain CBS 132557 / TC161) TaxID=1328760 RepID=A0A165GW27_XYLHT|nr:hypothetical protein L228DRAFT_247029 [Xylona heveae TC161]KZF22670.1 hypothetical protein L228DRAFT_247029 [Xylona heveae TC161]
MKFPPQLWRPFTAFLITGPGLGILLDTYFIYTNGSWLETQSARLNQPGDFFTYVVFVCLFILVANGGVLGGMIFTSALVMALVYTHAQENRGRKATLFVITIPIEWLPYAILLLTFIMGGSQAAIEQSTGIFAAHLYDFLTRIWPAFGGGRNYIQTPNFVRRWFERPGPQSRPYGTAWNPRTTQQSSRGSSSGISNLWGTRGQGRRLGGD